MQACTPSQAQSQVSIIHAQVRDRDCDQSVKHTHTWLHNHTHRNSACTRYNFLCYLRNVLRRREKAMPRRYQSSFQRAVVGHSSTDYEGKGCYLQRQLQRGRGRSSRVIRYRFMCSLTCHRKSSRDSTASIYMLSTARRDVTGLAFNSVRILHECRHFSSHKHSNTKQSCKTFRLQMLFYGDINFCFKRPEWFILQSPKDQTCLSYLHVHIVEILGLWATTAPGSSKIETGNSFGENNIAC